jgi:hypothetical protein
MKRSFRSRVAVACAFLCLVGLVGCGAKKGVELKGSVVLPKNMPLGNGSVTVTLIPEDKSGTEASANVTSKDTTVAFRRSDVDGVLPGKYKVVARLKAYAGSPEAAKVAASYKQFNKLYDHEKTKLTCEVTADPNQAITIDLNAGKVTKN